MGDKKVLVVMAGRSTTGRQYGMLESLPEEARAPIQAALDEANVEIRTGLLSQDEETQRKWFGEAHAIIPAGLVDAELLDKCPNLALVSCGAVGYDNVDAVECARRGVWVANAGGASIDTTSDTALMLMLNIMRRGAINHELVRASSLAQDVATRKWGWATGHSLGDDPEGKTLGIIGFGRIGQSLARKCNLAFGMKIIYYDVRHIVQSAVPTAVKVSMEELLQTSDVVTVHVDLNERTHHMLSTEQFAMMKDGVYVINAARGPIVDEEALATALEEGKVAGAGLDVYEDEPQGPLQRLAKVDNVMFQPHTGAATTHARQLNMEQCFRNVLEVLAHGRAPLTPVNEPESPKIGEKLPIAFPPAKDISLGVFAVAAAKPKL